MRTTKHVAWRLCGFLMFACFSGQAWSLGLGEMDLQSALNERFEANIDLFDTGGLDAAEIRVSLASAEDFERVGVERFFFLTSLKFEIKQVRGKPAIKVTSTQPISEPYLNFLVEVLWPSGRMLKEYTVLLDPPTFTQAAAPDVLAPSRDSGSQVAGAIDRGQVNVPRNSTSSRNSSGATAPRSSGLNSDGTYGATGRNDTLWKIASDTLPATDVSVQQNMLAIKRLNPKAFIRDNINLLKAGYVLRTPTAPQARELTQNQAQQRVNLENEAWRTGRSLPETGTQVAANAEPELKAQVDATEPASKPSSSATNNEGQLRIVAEAGDSAQGAAEANADGVGGAAALEERDRLSRELEELTYKMDRELETASNQVTVKERQLEVKDQEISELQAQVVQMREEMERLTAERGQNQSPVANAQTAWWQSPTVLGGGLGALVLLSVGGLLFARKRRAEAEAEYYAHEAAVEADLAAGGRAEPVIAGAVALEEDQTEALETDLEEQSSWEAEALAEPDAALDTGDTELDDALDMEDTQLAYASEGDQEGQNVEALQEGQIGDVIGESEIYIAYGRIPQAVNLLTGALAQDPDRHDVRCKLLELYAEGNERDGFNTEMAALTERCDDPEILDTARALEERLLEVSQDVAQASEPVEESDATEFAAVDDFELSLDNETEDSAATVDLSDVELDNGDDFELEIDDIEDHTDAADVADLDAGAGEQLGGDLGLDFDPEQAPAAELSETVAVATDEAADDDTMLDIDAILEDNASADADGDGLDFSDNGDEFDFADADDGASTKLDLAKAYLDMGDEDGARDILNEVLTEGSETQQQQAQELLETI